MLPKLQHFAYTHNCSMSGSDTDKTIPYDYSQSYRDSKDRRDSEQHTIQQQPRIPPEDKKIASPSSKEQTAAFEDVSLQDTRADKERKAKKAGESEAKKRERELEEEPEEIKKVGSAPNAKPWLKNPGGTWGDSARKFLSDLERK